MWRISYRTMSLQDVLIMAYMNVLQPKSWTQPAGGGDVRTGFGTQQFVRNDIIGQHSKASESLRFHLP